MSINQPRDNVGRWAPTGLPPSRDAVDSLRAAERPEPAAAGSIPQGPPPRLCRVHGVAGGTKFGANAGRSEYGAKGEAAVGKWLAHMLRDDPDVDIYHDRTIPDMQANADHVLVRGNNVVVIETKTWAPGRYWSLFGYSFRGWRRFRPADRRGLDAAVARYQAALGPSVRVFGVIVVHPMGRDGTWKLRVRKWPIGLAASENGPNGRSAKGIIMDRLYRGSTPGNRVAPRSDIQAFFSYMTHGGVKYG